MTFTSGLKTKAKTAKKKTARTLPPPDARRPHERKRSTRRRQRTVRKPAPHSKPKPRKRFELEPDGRGPAGEGQPDYYPTLRGIAYEVG